MKELDLQEIKKRELELMKMIHTICETNGWSYSLAAGTLLGAIRHQGFIPWDDDIDILMPRHDYEQFINYCNSNDCIFYMLNCNTNKEYGWLHSKICDKSTVLEQKIGYRTNYLGGVFVDVFPIDGLGNSKKKAKKMFQSVRFKMELLNASNWKRYVKSSTKGIIYEPIRFIFFLLSRFVSPNKLACNIEKKIKENSMDTYKYSGCLCGSYRKKEILDSKVFKKYIFTNFEGEKFYIFADYDKYLQSLYGDYMKLPPRDKQVSHHNFKVYLKEGERKNG